MYRTSQNLIDNVIRDGQWRDILDVELNDDDNLCNAKCVVDIELRQQPVDSTVLHHCFQLCWSDEIVPDIYLFFPNTADKTNDQVICTNTFSTFSALDKRIEHALKNTKIRHDALTCRNMGGLKMAVATGEHVFRVWGVQQEHTYYLYMLEVFTRSGSDGYIHEPLNKVPAIIEMDGKMRFVNITVLDVTIQNRYQVYNNNRLLLPLKLTSIKFMTIPLTQPMFTSERIERTGNHGPTLITQSKKVAVHDAKNIHINTDEVLFINMEDDDDDDNDDIDNVTGDSEHDRHRHINANLSMIQKDKNEQHSDGSVGMYDDVTLVSSPRLQLINENTADDYL